MNPSLVSHGFATLPPLPGCALTPLLRPRPRQTAPAAVLALAVLQTWRRQNRHRGPRCGLVAVNGADFLNALDQEDPGRSSLRAEWAVPGDLVFEHGSTNGGSNGLVRVTGSGASSGGSWRRLRFNETTEQSVLLLDASLRPRYEALAFGYLKSLAAVGSASLRCLGTAAPWRILVLGVGLGALPGWFSTKAKALVHAVDLDPMVLDAASSVGAMPPAIQGSLQACLADAQQNLSAETVATYCCDGVEYVAACAKEAVRYDLIVIDVFDGQGNTPETFLTEDFGRNCAAISTACVVNLTCPVPMWEDAHSYNAPSAGRLADAFQSSFQSKVWSVRVPEGQNLIMAATRMGAPPENYLEEAALELAQENLFAFDPVRRVSVRRQDW